MAEHFINPFLLKKELQESWSKYLLCSLMLGLTAVWIVILYSTNTGPFPLFRDTGVDLATGQSEFTFYIIEYWLMGVLPLLGAAAAIVLGMGAFSLERARGTLLFLLNTPLTRDTIFCTKTFSGILLLCGSLLVSVPTLFLTSRLLGYTLLYGYFSVAFFLTLIGLIFFLQLSIFFSVLSADPVKAGAASAFCCFILYSAGLFEKTRLISPFYYMRGGTYYDGGPFPWLYIIVILAASFAIYRLGRHFWQRLEG